jgi:transcriptional regulator with XRE-family HTH domain
MRHFAHALREELARAGLSPYYLAEFTGLDPAFVRRLVSGEKNASLQTVIALAMALVSDPERFKADPMVAQVLSRLVAAAMADAVAGGRRRA